MTHLHLHTDYSVLDSTIKVKDLVKHAKAAGHKAVAITDHGTLGGVIEFHEECKKAKIKPILGCEFYHDVGGKTNYHIIGLARNRKGFDELVKLNIKATENMYTKPRVTDKEILGTKNVIWLSACIQGYMAHTILCDKLDKKWFFKMLDAGLYPEVQLCGMPEQQFVCDFLRKNGYKYVRTQDVHYLKKEDRRAHDVLYAIMSHKPLGTYTLGGDYSFDEDFETLADEIADEVEEYDVITGDWQMPDIEIKEAQYDRLEKRLQAVAPKGELDTYKARLLYEFDIIQKNGFLPYFEVMSQLCAHFDRMGHFRGWGRGSASGSLVSYLLRITKLDPIRWGLYFERFLNPDRISPPDIDLDFTPDDRDRAIEFMAASYGAFKKIGSYGTFGTRDTLNQVAKVMKVSTQLQSFVPNESPVPTLKELMKTHAFKAQVEKEKNQEFMRVCLKIEGLKKSRSIHPSGIVEATGIPLRAKKVGKEWETYTDWDMHTLEKIKRIKFDILGLTNLQVIEDVCRAVNMTVEDIPLDDKPTYDLICSGHTMGVFQWESTGYVDLIKQIQPRTFDELVDLNTLYRPGCMESGLTSMYIQRKNGQEWEQMHPDLKLKSYGLPLFQEDIMTVARVVAGFTGPEADTLRKAIGKKDKKLLQSLNEKWMKGGGGKELWEIVEKFGRYTWNLSHAVAYTMISYWTAYLSANYPAQFICALLNSFDISRRPLLLAECRRRSVKVYKPDLNESMLNYSVTKVKKDYGILIGFSGVKYIGQKTSEKIMKNQPYLSKDNFIKESGVNKRQLSVLERAGLFSDSISIDDERELFGYYISKRKIDTIWWGTYGNIGEVLDVHKKTTRRGDPMAFLTVEFKTGIESVTVFPDVWRVAHLQHGKLQKGDIGLFRVDERGVLAGYADEIEAFRVELESKFPMEMNSHPNVFYKGAPIGTVIMDEAALKGLEQVGIRRIW